MTTNTEFDGWMVYHCELCGSEDPEDTETGDDPDFQGYSRCCNEPTVFGPAKDCKDSRCGHRK